MVVVFEELELELFPELELELFPELELLLELLPELELELELFPELELELFPELELELLFPPPFRRERLPRESREVMNGTNMASGKSEKEKRQGVKRFRERACFMRIREEECGYGPNLVRCSLRFKAV